jgi:myo-inositol-1(or 4)-monophosphatase
MAADIVIAREAGALVVDLNGSDYTLRSGVTVAAAPNLIADFLQLVTETISA